MMLVRAFVIVLFCSVVRGETFGQCSLDEIQLTGCNTDCGMVEMKMDGEWFGLRPVRWTMEVADLACRAVGFEVAASMTSTGKRRKNVAVVDWKEGCMTILGVEEDGEGVGVSCRSGGLLVDKANESIVEDWTWKAKARAERALREGKLIPEFPTDLSKAYVYADDVAVEFLKLERTIRSKRIVEQPRINALGVFNADEISAEVYSSLNPHSRFIFETDFFSSSSSAARGNDISLELRRDGIAMIEDFGLSDYQLDELERQAREAVAGGVNVSVASGGQVATARVEIPALEPILQNETLLAAVRGYLGEECLLDGYKATELRTKDSEAYVASLWHHDRVGRRLKMFVYVHDVDCVEGHPTLVAKGSQNLTYYKTDSFAFSRFNDEYVRANFQIKAACGKRGGGFLFDTHTVHKGTPEGKFDRLTIIAEFHQAHKCSAANTLNLGLPCPSGDQYPLGRRF